MNTSEQVDVGANDRLEGVVAHFVAHNKAVVALEFDANGSLLLTCDKMGSYFNLFKIVPHPAGSSYSAVHHLYSLYRGDTPGSVQVKQAYFFQRSANNRRIFFARMLRNTVSAYNFGPLKAYRFALRFFCCIN